MPKFDEARDLLRAMEALREHAQTRPVPDAETRIRTLNRLKAYLKAREGELLDALHHDLGKAPFESYAAEVSLVYHEIDEMCRNLKRWTAPRRARTPLTLMPARSYTVAQPWGHMLVIAPWNYPVNLSLIPLVDALAAGNCVVLKPSREAAATAEALDAVLSEFFAPEEVLVARVGGALHERLLDFDWKHICFTGSPATGRTIMAAAARHLTPVTLELGGKSPAVVFEDARMDRAAGRIAWGKAMNAGQTCVAPDHVFVHERRLKPLLVGLKRAWRRMYGRDALEGPDWPKIVNDRQFERLVGYIEAARAKQPGAGAIAFGGRYDRATLKIEPTVILDPAPGSEVMRHEIFGPVLPVIPFDDPAPIFERLRRGDEPLALYLFGRDVRRLRRLVRDTPCGGAMINDVLVHVGNGHLPLSGRGNSGMGRYHGRAGFEQFSHRVSVMEAATAVDVKLRCAPYKGKLERYKRFI